MKLTLKGLGAMLGVCSTLICTLPLFADGIRKPKQLTNGPAQLTNGPGYFDETGCAYQKIWHSPGYS